MNKYLEERVKDLEEKVERLQKQLYEIYTPKVRGPSTIPNTVWPQTQPDLGKQIGDNQQPCYWDNIPEKDRLQPIGLSCPCPKCSPWCNAGDNVEEGDSSTPPKPFMQITNLPMPTLTKEMVDNYLLRNKDE